MTARAILVDGLDYVAATDCSLREFNLLNQNGSR
jgi:hypothetical protein